MMQPRFERRTGRSPWGLVEHLRFRAGYDFLLLRCQSGELPEEIGRWWTDFQGADNEQREALIAAAQASRSAGGPGSGAGARKRRRRSGRKRSESAGEGRDLSDPGQAA